MTALGRKHLNPESALRQIQFTYPLACKIVCFKADGCKLDLGPKADTHNSFQFLMTLFDIYSLIIIYISLYDIFRLIHVKN